MYQDDQALGELAFLRKARRSFKKATRRLRPKNIVRTLTAKPMRVTKKFVRRLAPKNIVRTITRAPTRFTKWPGKITNMMVKTKRPAGRTTIGLRQLRAQVAAAKKAKKVKTIPRKVVPRKVVPRKVAPPEATSELVKGTDSSLVGPAGSSILVDNVTKSGPSNYRPTSTLITGGSSFRSDELLREQGEKRAADSGEPGRFSGLGVGAMAAAGVGGLALLMMMRKK